MPLPTVVARASRAVSEKNPWVLSFPSPPSFSLRLVKSQNAAAATARTAMPAGPDGLGWDAAGGALLPDVPGTSLPDPGRAAGGDGSAAGGGSGARVPTDIDRRLRLGRGGGRLKRPRDPGQGRPVPLPGRWRRHPRRGWSSG